MKILGIAGSLRAGSYNRLLLYAASELAPAGMHIERYDELRAIPMFDQDLELATGGGPESVQHLRRLVERADGILFATPEYNDSIPGVLKNAIDWLSRPAPQNVLAGKPAAIMGATPGRFGTVSAQQALRQVLFSTGALVMTNPSLFAREAANLFDWSGRLTDPPTRERMAAILLAFHRWISLLTGRPVTPPAPRRDPPRVPGTSSSDLPGSRSGSEIPPGCGTTSGSPE